MRALNRNKQKFCYALYVEKVPVIHDGLETGEFNIMYTKPIHLYGNISAARGRAETRQFGEDLQYDKVIVLSGTKSPIDEFSILWIDTLPEFNDIGENNTPHDYIVRRVAQSINSVAIAINKVDVSPGKPFPRSCAAYPPDYGGKE